MGDLMGSAETSQELETMKAQTAVSMNIGKIITDVEGIYADGMHKDMPVFDVEDDDFYKNMKVDRQRLRFQSDHPVSNYLRQTRYKKPFFIKTRDGRFMRKVK